MKMEATQDFIFFILMVTTGVVLEMGVSKIHFFIFKNHYKERHFTPGKYLFFLLFLLIAFLIITFKNGLTLLKVFQMFAIISTMLELIGFSYNVIVGQRLWTYHRYTLTKYTSLLSIPICGLAGVLFWLLARVYL